MKQDQLMEAIELAGLRPIAYSGRGMYGEQCIACVLSDRDQGRYLPQKGRSEDSLGYNTIFYWPRVAAPAWLEGAA